ncbi:MAG TPA: hypothetical protein VJ654_19290 [Noviherbaspirillum sp.]|nr:hypothetical protein [Noviherbaspirillum sp.]
MLRWGAVAVLAIAQSLAGNAWATPKVYGYALGVIEGTGGRCVKTTPSCITIFVFDVAEFGGDKPFPLPVKVWESLPEGMNRPPEPQLDALQQAVLERLKAKRAEYGFNKVYYYEIKIAPQPEDYFVNRRDRDSVHSSRRSFLKSKLDDPRMMRVEYPGLWVGQVPESASQTRSGEASGNLAVSGKTNATPKLTEPPVVAGTHSDKEHTSASSSSSSNVGNAANTSKRNQPGTAAVSAQPVAMQDPVARKAAARDAADKMPEPKHWRVERLEALMVAPDEAWGCAWGSAYIESDEGVAPGGRRVHEIKTTYGCKCSDTTWKGKPAKSCLTSYSRAVTSKDPLKKSAGFHGGYGMYFALPGDHRDPKALNERLEQAWREVGGVGPMPPYVHPKNIEW